MNIGQLMRGMLGEAQQDGAKALELKIGQIVRGVILQMLEEQDALVQINGYTVRAKLETAMQPGQTTMLQVQPESGRGQIVLKPVDLPGAALPEETVRDLARMLGLPDKKWAHELVRDLKRDGFPLTREAGAALRQAAAAALPAGAADEQWMQAAAAAFKRGLPMTAATVGALRQALFGKPAGELLQALGAQLAKLAGGGAAEGQAQQGPAAGGSRTAMPEAAARVQALLAEGEALIRAAAGGAAAGGGSSGASATGAQASPRQAAGAQAGAQAAGGQAAGAQAGAQAAGAQAAGTPGSGTQAAGAQSAGAQAAGMQTAGMQTAGMQTAGVQPAGTQAPQGERAAAGASAGTGEQAAAAAGAGAARQTAASSIASGGGQWLGGLLKWLGVDHEKLLAQTLGGARTEEADAAQTRRTDAQQQVGADEQGANRPFFASADRLAASGERFVAANANGGLPMLQSEGTISEQAKPAAAESLKSALMSLASAEDVSPAVRETAQQLVNQITGQQLLLSPERNGQLLSQTTLFIPFQGPDGSQTASVHIQSRRGRKGELDADNCRLLFDLKMKRLGDTVVDVHVVNKIVSLSVWNDHPAARAMLETSRRELTDALAGAGFQLLSLNVKPMPEPASGQPEDSGSAGAAARLPGTATAYSSKPYKGVDFRV